MPNVIPVLKREALPVFVREPGPVPLLERAALHEFYAANGADAPCIVALMLGSAFESSSRPVLWVRQEFFTRESGLPYYQGLAEFIPDPSLAILIRAKDAQSALQAGLEGARSAALGAVLIELWGEANALDLTASRRLALAAKASGALVLMARIAARPRPSAAQTRWEVAAAPSRALAANAPGSPAFELTVLRARNGREGMRYHVEWDHHARSFIWRSAGAGSLPRPIICAEAAPLPGAVVTVSFDRPGAQAGPGEDFARTG